MDDKSVQGRRAPKSSPIDVRKPRDIRAANSHLSAMDMDFEACRRAFLTRDPRFDGRIFGAVRTTGIYCRPICPARTPKAQNMTFYPTAAACQEAGYRPCLRCRPESSPDLGAWRGTSNTVSRALALIEAGPGASRRGGAQPRAVAAAKAAAPGPPPADGRGRPGVGLRRRAPLQRAVPAAVRPPAGRTAPQPRRRGLGGDRRHHREAALPAAI